jgi:hypothetical protein
VEARGCSGRGESFKGQTPGEPEPWQWMKHSAAWVNDFPPGVNSGAAARLVTGETAGEVGAREGHPTGGRETLWRRKAHERRCLKHGSWADDGKTRGRVIKP